jgi:hypothetical protein
VYRRIATVVRDSIPKVEEIQEGTRRACPNPFLQENGYQPSRKKERKKEYFFFSGI